MAQALDISLSRSRKLENRRRLERATAAYYEALSPEAQAEDEAWVDAASRAGAEIDFDRE